MTIKQHGGIFGRNPTFNIATAAEFVGPVSGLATSAAALKSSATTGLMQITGPAAGATRIMTTPDANFAAARTDAAQSFTGDQTLTDGNLIVSNGKGIDFSATSGAGTSELFDDYEEGTWTPAYVGSGGNPTVVYSNQNASYVKIGRMVYFQAYIVVSTTSGGSGNLSISGLPYASEAVGLGLGGAVATWKFSAWTSQAPEFGHIGAGSSSILLAYANATGNSTLQTGSLANGCELAIQGFYMAA